MAACLMVSFLEKATLGFIVSTGFGRGVYMDDRRNTFVVLRGGFFAGFSDIVTSRLHPRHARNTRIVLDFPRRHHTKTVPNQTKTVTDMYLVEKTRLQTRARAEL